MIKHHLRELRDLIGCEVVHSDSAPGKLAGLVVNPDDWRIASGVVAKSATPQQAIVVPIRLFGALDDEHRTLHLDCSEAALRSAIADSADRLAKDGLVDAAALLGRPVVGCGEAAGTVDNLLVNVSAWQIRYLVIRADTQLVLIDIEWCSSCGGDSDPLRIDRPAAAVASAPPYQDLSELCSGYEEALYRHYTSRAFDTQGDAA